MTIYTQILIYIVVITLTVIFAIIGWQIILILKEIRKMLEKTNRMMDKAASMSSKIGYALDNFSGFFQGIKAMVQIFNLFKKVSKKKEEKDE